METVAIPAVKLGSGVGTMPCIGMGTAVYPFVENAEITKSAVLEAIRLGYRHFDTASLYLSEKALGQAIADALRNGLIKSRDELFITSKLWCTDAHPHLVLPALQKSLRNLQLEYLDLYLIHWPMSVKPGEITVPVEKDNLLPMDLRSVWEAMEECQSLGLTKAVGVSNFSCKKLELLLTTAKVKPAVNQVEMNPLLRQNKLREFCERRDINICAYSPLGAKGTLWGDNQVMECQVLKEIARIRGKTLAQVCLRWVYEQKVSVLVKSFSKERLKENLGIFDWALSEEDKQKINQLPQYRSVSGASVGLIAENGPYQCVEELFDEDV
ncbi:non-functional NADPH-dependent codeinone reductase 2-like [Aristolochia californica]|uniref:non-functional NADPH-dependent codeinone reductase 2-like n=1 Tax=Aristolochia californica TaxID=171875 RepID=UPI0035D91D7F